MHRLIALNGSTSALDRSEPEACRYPLLNESMVLLDDVVQIRRGSAATAPAKFTGLLQVGNCAGIGWVAIDVDDARTWCAAGQRDPQEKLRRDQVPLRRQHELDRLPGRIDGAIQVRPPTRDLDVGLIHAPGPVR